MTETDRYNATILRITGVSLDRLNILANLYYEPMDPNEITSMISTLSYIPSVHGSTLYSAETWFTAMDQSIGNYLFVVSAEGELHHNKRGQWEVIDLNCPEGLSDIWACSDDEAFAVGLSGDRVHMVGGSFNVTRDKSKRRLSAVHGTSSNNVFAVGNEGFVSRFNGKEWIEVEPATNYNLLTVFCLSEKATYIAGAGILLKWTGEDLEKIDIPEITITSLAWYNDKIYAAGGKDGIYVLNPKGIEKIKDLILYRLRTINGFLFGVGNKLVARYDGSAWKGGNLEI